MTSARTRLSVLAVVPVTTALLGAALAAPADAAGTTAPGLTRIGEGVQIPFLADDVDAGTVVEDSSSTLVGPQAVTATINVTYHNFSPAARASFQRAVNVWKQNVRSSVPINIDATYKPLGAGVLGSAGSRFIWQNNTTKTLLVDALANKSVGRQLDPAPDIVANFSSSFSNWHFGTGPAPTGTYDFQSVVTHEIGHGLGFLGSASVSGGVGRVGSNGFAFRYDRAVENGAGRKILSFANGTTALRQQLTGGSLFFDTTQVRNANGGRPAKIYAPATWQPGSSYSHLDEGTYRAGSPNSLMTPQLGRKETIRTPGPIVKAVFASIGW